MTNLYKKVLELQKTIKPIEKDSTNPHFKSKYFDINSLLADVKPVLSTLGLIVMQPLCVREGRPAINTIIIDADSGEKLEEPMFMPENSDPQKMGSVISYYRRYALTSLLALEGEDDDAESAKPPAKTYSQPVAKPPAAAVAGDLGNCKDCGAPNRLSQAGKKYCGAKCWLAPKTQPSAPHSVQEPKHDTYQVVPPLDHTEGYTPAPNADEVRLEDIPF